MRYRIGTRGSALALAQAEIVRERLSARFPEHQFELETVKTTGDKFGNIPMRQIGAKGIFIKELEERLIDGSIDLAVHSMKDMPSELPEGLCLAQAWEREDPRDALILREKQSFAELPAGAVIGTGSLRRKYQLLRLRPDLAVVDIRGNVETRLRKMEEQRLDGIVLAAAGLKRLHMENRITQYFSFEEMVPAPAQGALAIEYAKAREDVALLLTECADPDTERAVRAERELLALTGGGCHQPVGAAASLIEGGLCLWAMAGDEDGEQLCFAKVRDTDPGRAARRAAEQLGLPEVQKAWADISDQVHS